MGLDTTGSPGRRSTGETAGRADRSPGATTPRPPQRRGSAAVMAVAGTLVVLTGCGGDRSQSTTTEARSSQRADAASRFSEAHAGVCDAVDAAAGDAQEAEAIFFDRAHDALHQLARTLEETDRPLAARLLAAKQDVEADLARAPRPETLRADLAELAAVAGEAVDRVGVEPAECAR